jgi:hypothetical protein
VRRLSRRSRSGGGPERGCGGRSPCEQKTKHSGEGRRSRNQRVGRIGTEESIGESKNRRRIGKGVVWSVARGVVEGRPEGGHKEGEGD